MARAKSRIGTAALIGFGELVALGVFAPFSAAAAAAERLEVGIVAAALPIGDGTGELALPFVVDLSSGDGRDAAPLANGEVQIELRDADGRVRTSFGQPYGVAPPAAPATTEGDQEAAAPPAASPNASPNVDTTRALRLYGDLRLPPGSYTLAATAKDAASGASGHASVAIRLPEGTSEAWIASPALVSGRRTGWRPARFEQSAVPELPYAFVNAGGAAFLPAARLETGSVEKLAAEVLIATPSAEFPFVVGELVDTASGKARSLPVQVTGVHPSQYAGVLGLTLELGPLGEPGDYRLRLGLVGTGGGGLVTPIGANLEVRVRAGGTAGNMGGGALESATLPALAPDANLTSGYRRVLALLAEQGVEATAPELVRFELGARAPADGRRARSSLGALREAERAVAGELGALEGRLPVGALHLEAAALYRQQREVSMAAESVQLVTEMLSEPLNGSARDAEPAVRARAVDLLALARPSAALAVDPDHPLALLRTALVAERTRQYVQASQAMERLLKVEPANVEARLRAGVVYHRRGQLSDARRELERVVGGSSPGAGDDWILELAYSELGAIEEESGHPAEAERWLRQGIERIEAQSLHLQLAFYLDRANRWTEATTVVNRLPVARVDGHASARLLYTIEPIEELAATRERVAAAVEAALPALRRSLATGGAREAGR